MPTPRLPLHLLLALSVPLSGTACATTAPEKPPVIIVAAEPTDRNASPMQQAYGGAAGNEESALTHQSYPVMNLNGGDTDKDGILDDADKCPDEPEDRDGFQDDDGCPDLDNDADGVLDRVDLCPNDPETVNGLQDEDGCPDSNLDRAKKAFREGATAFTQGDYVKACKFFEEAYNLEPRDTVLFNMAVCADKQNNRPLACQYYNRWRATPTSATATARIPSLETCP